MEANADLDPQAQSPHSLPAEIYHELRAMARQLLQRERPNHTLQPTALVHEAWLRVAQDRAAVRAAKPGVLAAMACIMRRLLVDHARRHRAKKRGGAAIAVTLDESACQVEGPSIDILALHAALEELATLHARQATIIELRFFGGLTVAEVADVLGVGSTTVEQDWRMARAWLTLRLQDIGKA